MGLMDDAKRAAKRSADLAEMSDAKRVDRLRAERDTWRNVAESHEPATSLMQAEFARMDLELGRLRADAVRRIEETDRVLVANGRLRTQLAEAKEALRLSAQGLHTYVEALNAGNAALAAKDARIAELEEKVTEWRVQSSIYKKRADAAKDPAGAVARAERAEAERDALHLFSGAQAAVIKEMREALELVLKYEHEWLAPTSLADVARAALAPSPAGREERHEMTSIGDKEPDADSAGREG